MIESALEMEADALDADIGAGAEHDGIEDSSEYTAKSGRRYKIHWSVEKIWDEEECENEQRDC